MIAAIAFFFGIGRFGGHPCVGKLNNDYNHWWWNYWNYCINYTEEMMAKKAYRKCRWFWGDQPAVDDFLSAGITIPVHQDTVLDAQEWIVGLGRKLWETKTKDSTQYRSVILLIVRSQAGVCSSVCHWNKVLIKIKILQIKTKC